MPEVKIHQINVRLRGVSPLLAQAAVAQLQPALRSALQGHAGLGAESAKNIDLGTLRLVAQPDAGRLAEEIAGCIAGRLAAPRNPTLT